MDEEEHVTYAYICNKPKCGEVYSSKEESMNHVCSEISKNEIAIEIKTEDKDINESCPEIRFVELDENEYAAGTHQTIIMHDKEAVTYEIDNGTGTGMSFQLKNGREEYELVDGGSLKRRRNCNNHEIRNKLVRDPYFKLDRNSYTFKETLGDWDESSTRLLISLVGEIHDAHFILKHYHERRLVYWEKIQLFMSSKGYNFTILQLRMRWRELFAKYRWTVNHNDLYPEKKTFEYMNDMDNLFGVWSTKATMALLHLIDQWQKGNGSVKNKRIAYAHWDQLTQKMQLQGYKYKLHQVEGRWKNLTLTYKSVIDHNLMPTVEPIEAAFRVQLSQLITYEPRRRKDYEKYSGKKVRLEKFPEQGMKHLIQIYKNNIDNFQSDSVKNADVWDAIQESLAELNYNYTVSKIKEIFFATLKLYERVLQHNSIPGAIKREGPHYKELSDIYDSYGYWPHVKRKRKTHNEKLDRKYTLKLRESMQMWTTPESEALLHIYPRVLEKLLNHSSTPNANPPPSLDSELWLQVAEAFHGAGHPKRDIPEIATHIGLLRLGFQQDNNFPFSDLMAKVIQVEEALCCSLDVSKYTGDVEIYYWSHDAVHTMLNLYLRIQNLLPFSALTKEVFARITKEMNTMGYKYSFIDVENEFRKLLCQFSRRNKNDKFPKESNYRYGKGKIAIAYKAKMMEVLKLREELSVSFTNGIKPIPLEDQGIILKVGLSKSREFFTFYVEDYDDQKERLKAVIMEIRKEIKRVCSKKPPAARKICVQLLSFLFNGNDNTTFDDDIQGLKLTFENYDFEKLITDIMAECHNGSFQIARRSTSQFSQRGKLRPNENDDDFCVLHLGDFQDSVVKCEPVDYVQPTEDIEGSNEENRTFYIDEDLGVQTTVVSNPDSEVMISIDEMDDRNIKVERDHQEEEQALHVVQEEDPLTDKELLFGEIQSLALHTKKLEKNSLRCLKKRNLKRKEILEVLSSNITELLS